MHYSGVKYWRSGDYVAHSYQLPGRSWGLGEEEGKDGEVREDVNGLMGG